MPYDDTTVSACSGAMRCVRAPLEHDASEPVSATSPAAHPRSTPFRSKARRVIGVPTLSR